MKFEVSSGKIIISDPCYTAGSGGNIILENVKNGIWKASYSVLDCRIESLSAFCGEVRKFDCIWEELKEGIDVDSGQAGIFDLKKYRRDEFVDGKITFDRGVDEPGEKFYAKCCDVTLSKEQVGVVNGGAVSSSGYGDGSYRCFVLKDADDKIFGVKISFIDDEYENEEYDDDEYGEEDGESDEE
jgi:hypothetical protein